MTEEKIDLNRAIQHAETAAELAGIQGTNVTIETAVLRRLIEAAKRVPKFCDLANSANAAHTVWSRAIAAGIEAIPKGILVQSMELPMIALGRALWEALPERQRKALTGMAAAMDEKGNVLEDFDGNPIKLSPEALDRIDTVAVNPLGELIDAALQVSQFLDETAYDETPLSETVIEEARRRLARAVARMEPWMPYKP